MKHLIHTVLTASIMACLANASFSQSTTLGHIAFLWQQNTHYLGWQNNAIPLYFRTGSHNGNQNRMLIYNGGFTSNTGRIAMPFHFIHFISIGGFTSNTGRIAMGNDLPNNFVPQSRLHLHQRGGLVDLRFTTNNTGSGANTNHRLYPYRNRHRTTHLHLPRCGNGYRAGNGDQLRHCSTTASAAATTG